MYKAAFLPPKGARELGSSRGSSRSTNSSILAAVKASGAGIRIPGENSSKIARERQAAGTMPIPKAIWESISNTAENGLPK